MQRDVIVIGGGIAGLQCARELRRGGKHPLVLERAKGVGGRCATRRFENQPIDFGPMFLHGGTRPFLQAVMEVDGVIMPSTWPSRIEGRGAPCQPSAFEPTEHRATIPAGLNAFAKHLASGLDLRLRTHVERIEQEGSQFFLFTDAGETFACRDLVVAMAVEQIRGLLGTMAPQTELEGIQTLLGMFASVPSLALMAAYPRETAVPDWDILYPEESTCLQLIAQDFRKREQPRYVTLVIQARPRWSRERLDLPEEVWSAELLREASRHVGDWVMQPLWTSSHRWRFARVDRGNELARPLLTRFQSGARLGLAGDVFSPGGGVQAAWLSGSALAQRLLNEA